jgi:hypothetical protein
MSNFKIEFMWFIHNVFAHPFSELCYWLGCLYPKFRVLGNTVHDVTIPKNYTEGRG